MQSKLNNKGIPCMMVGYAKDNASGTFLLLNLETARIFLSRHVYWLHKTYEEYRKDSKRQDNDYFSDYTSSAYTIDDYSSTDTKTSTNQGENIQSTRTTQQVGNPVINRTRSRSVTF